MRDIRQVDINESISNDVKARCYCKNIEWREYAVGIKPILVGGLVLGYSITLRLECTRCGSCMKRDIGNFNKDLEVVKDLDTIYCAHDEIMIKRFRELCADKELLENIKKGL